MSLFTAKPPSVAVENPYAEREFRFTQRDFRHITAVLQKETGIALGDLKASMVYARLVKRLRALSMTSFEQYCALVETARGAAERERMIEALTTNVTRFFRERHHFDHLRTKVLPELTEGIRRGRPLRIWSAGCSSGEEPYSIALTILSVMPDAAKFDVKVLATDINRKVLDEGRTGAYREATIAPLAPQQSAEWFETSVNDAGEKIWRVGGMLRGLVAFRELNLIADWPLKQAYQAIFCRNVTIYLEEHARSRIWNRFADRLAPRGCLYLGHSERAIDADGRLRVEGYTTYRLAERT